MKVMESQGLAPAHHDERWVIPTTEGEICQQVLDLMVDIQMIENLLIQAGLADETVLYPITPRWRVNGKKHHDRNTKILEGTVKALVHEEIRNFGEKYGGKIKFNLTKE